MTRVLTVVYGSTTIEFVDGSSKMFNLVRYVQNVPTLKGGGVFQSSALGDGRVPIMRKRNNVFDEITFTIDGRLVASADQDDVIDALSQLISIITERVGEYWELPRRTPVYATRKALSETGTQYALIVAGNIANIGDLQGIEFEQLVLVELSLQLELRYWQSTIPGTGAATSLVLNPWQTVTSYEAELLALDVPPVALWALDDTSGTTAVSSIGAGQNGTYYDESLNSLLFLTGVPAAFLGIGNGAIDINTAAFRGVFSHTAGTLFLWVRSSGGIVWTSGNEHPVWYLYVDANNSFYLRKTTTDEQVAFTVTTPSGEHTIYIEGVNTTEWVCLAATWNATLDRIRLYLNGTLVSEGSLTGVSSGTLTDAIIASTTVGLGPGFSGEMSHPAYFDRELTAAEVFEAYSVTAVGEETADQGEVYIANAQTSNNLTHIYTYDASLTTFSSNLASSIAYNLLPATVQNGDILYLARFDGINGIPFNSAVFDVNQAGVGYTITWQYYNGSWVTLTTQDNTNQLKNTGINSIHWIQPSDWATVAINGLTTYWIRGLVSGVSSPTTPTQQNRPVYTVRVPYFELLDTAVNGDIPALARYLFKTQSDSSSTDPELWANRLIAGLREHQEDDQFQAFINLSDRQNHPDITVGPTGGAVFATDLVAPSGRRITYNPSGATSLTLRVQITLGPSISADYTGRFHAYLRCRQVNGAAGDIGVQLRVRYGYGSQHQVVGEVAYTTPSTGVMLVDLGEVTINAGFVGDDISSNTFIDIFLSTASGTPDLYMYDLIFMPVENLFLDIIDGNADSITSLGRPGAAGIGVNTPSVLDLGSIANPRQFITAHIRDDNNGRIRATWDVQTANNEVSLLTGKRQRLWCLWGKADAGTWTFDPEIVNSIQVTRADRWLGSRGSG